MRRKKEVDGCTNQMAGHISIAILDPPLGNVEAERQPGVTVEEERGFTEPPPMNHKGDRF